MLWKSNDWIKISSNQINSFPFPFYLHSDSSNIDSFGNFLDDFAVNIFLPQIEDKVMQLIQNATVGKFGSLANCYSSMPSLIVDHVSQELMPSGMTIITKNFLVILLSE